MNEWIDIPGYEGAYQINEFGQIKSLNRIVVARGTLRHLKEVILKNSVKKEGYHFIRLSKDSIDIGYRINRLVAIVFIPNPFNLPEVDHKDGDKSNNHVSNLEWVSRQENLARAHVRRIARKKIAA